MMPLADIVAFSWYLHTLLKAGVPLARSLHLVGTQMRNPIWSRVLEEVVASLGKGESFADSLQRFPRFFPRYFIHLLDVGEISGNLDHVLQQLAIYGEKQMERLVRGRSQVRGRWRRAALWELGFRAFETRRYARAARYLGEYTPLATSAMDEARGHYWLGRAHRRGPKALDAYREAIAVEPLHWYAVLAASRLKKLQVEPPKPFENAVSPVSVEVPNERLPLPETFEVYRSLGLDLDGIAWLKAHENSLVAGEPKSRRIPLLTALYRDAGAYRESLLVARRRMVYLQSDPAQHRWWWDAAYPMPWRSVVDEHRGELPRALVYATMRQESGFRPEVVSRAGAVGLMQMMPELASKLTGKAVTRPMLRVPETNIELGLEEMAALAAEFHEVYPLSIAAYNAGKSRVKRWLKESRRMELDRFVERIPFNETRNYVRGVSTHYARYAYLDDPESGWPELPAFVNP